MVKSVFQINNEVVRNPFLHVLGPEIVRLVEKKAESVTVATEALQVLEMLLEMTPDTHSNDTLNVPLQPPIVPLPNLSLPSLSQNLTCWVCYSLF